MNMMQPVAVYSACDNLGMGTRMFWLPAASGVPRNFFLGGEGGSTNSVEDRGQREWRSGGSSPLVRGSTQFGNE
jgi:hypothetical protein